MYEKGLPSREIATELGLDVAAVYPLMTRARKEFRAALLEVIGEYHPDDSREELEARWSEVFSAL
jgi:DNA-directed RNA polymerase specialized sigma24 family protein